MADDPYAAFADPVDHTQAPHAANDPYAQFSDPAPITDAGTTMGFADEAPKEASSQLSAEDTAQFYKMLQGDGMPRASAKELRDFVASKGHALTNADEIVAQRDSGKGIVGKISYPFPKPADPSSIAGAAARGVTQGASLGFGDELHGLVGASASALTGGKFGDTYNSIVDADRGRLAADQEQHPYATIAGNIVGGLALPVGLERAGVTASMDAVGLSAYRSALAEGLSEGDAAAIAKRAIVRRIASEGAAYGGAYGAGSTDGSPSERLLGAASGAVSGAAIPIAAKGWAEALSPVLKPVGDFARRAVSPFTREGAVDAASAALSGAATRAPEDIANDIHAAPEPVAGVQPTLAEVAQDPGLAGLQRGHANTDLNTAAAMGERHAANALARTNAVTETLGGGSMQAIQNLASLKLAAAQNDTGAQQAFRQAAIDARLSGDRSAAAAARQGAEENLSGAISKIGSTADRDATGSSAREAFTNAYDAARARSNEAYSAPVLKQPQPITIPRPVFMKLREAADDFYGDGGGEIPAKLQSILSDMADPNATTRTLTNIDRRLADFAGEAGMQGRRSEAAFAQRVRNDLGAFVQQAAPKEYRDALNNAKAVRAEQGRIFETGAPSSAFAKDRFGNPSVGDNVVPSKLVRPGAAGGDAAESLIQAIGPDNAESIVRQELRRAADESGVTTAKQARALAVRYGEAARRFPAVQSDLQALEQHAATLEAAKGTETAALSAKPTPEEVASTKELSALHSSILSSPLGRVADPAVDPGSFVRQLLSRSDDGRQLKMLYAQIRHDPEAAAGFRRALGQYVETSGQGNNFTASGDQIPAVNATRKAISTVLDRAGNALSNEQKIVLRRVGRELESANFAFTAAKPAGSDTALNQTFKGMMHLFPGHAVPGGAAAKMLLSKVMDALGNGAEVKSLITQALLDPEFAATLLKRPTEKHWEQVRTGLIGRKSALGSAIVSQPANDVVPLHSMLVSALSRSPQAAGAENVDNRRQIPPQQQR